MRCSVSPIPAIIYTKKQDTSKSTHFLWANQPCIMISIWCVGVPPQSMTLFLDVYTIYSWVQTVVRLFSLHKLSYWILASGWPQILKIPNDTARLHDLIQARSQKSIRIPVEAMAPKCHCTFTQSALQNMFTVHYSSPPHILFLLLLSKAQTSVSCSQHQ